LIQWLACADQRAFGEQPALDHTGHLRAHFTGAERLGAAGQFGGEIGAGGRNHLIADLDRRFGGVFVRLPTGRKRGAKGD